MNEENNCFLRGMRSALLGIWCSLGTNSILSGENAIKYLFVALKVAMFPSSIMSWVKKKEEDIDIYHLF